MISRYHKEIVKYVDTHNDMDSLLFLTILLIPFPFFGLLMGLGYLPSIVTFNWIYLVIGVLVLSEFLFYGKDFNKKEHKSKFWFTAKRKLEALFESSLIIINSLNLIYLFKRIDFSKYPPVIIKWIGYIGIGLIALVIIGVVFYLWIKLNEMRVKK